MILQSLDMTIGQCVQRMRRASNEKTVEIAFEYGCGIAFGYYLAGEASQVDYSASCALLRKNADRRFIELGVRQRFDVVLTGEPVAA